MNDLDAEFCESRVYACYDDGVFGEKGAELYLRLRNAWFSDMAAATELEESA